MAAPLESVVKQLEDSGIVAAGKLENFVPPKAHPKDADELIAALVKENHLTKFQAAQISAGRAKSLILGGYTILDKIGAGGMGQVFKAEHRRMKRVVAIKMLPPAMVKDAAAVARFQREVEAAAKLRHTNIVAADDADEANGVHFLVMEYVEGKDLSATVKRDGPFPMAKAVNYILQAARGLEYAHSEGVVHRDIKPANLLLDKKGVVKILDMGLARIESHGNVAAQAELTGTGAVMGTVDYMAPEQGTSTKHADARADVYSLGCSLYYLLGGKPVYPGETIAAKLVAHHTEPIPDLRAVNADVTDQLDAVFRKMVAKRVDERYQTMTDVIADLEQCRGEGSTDGRGSSRQVDVSLPGSNSGLLPTIVTDAPAINTGKPAPTKRAISATSHLAAGIAPAGPADAAVKNARGQAPRQNKNKQFMMIAGGTLACAAVAAALFLAFRKNDVAPTPKPVAAAPTTNTPPPPPATPATRPTAPMISFFPTSNTPATTPAMFGQTPTPPAPPGVPGTPIDLLAQADVSRDAVKATWKREGATQIAGSGSLKLVTPSPMPEEYDVDLELERIDKSDKQGFVFGCLVQGRQPVAMMDFDGGDWYISSVDKMDKHDPAHPARITGVPLIPGRRTAVQLSVRRDGLRMLVDGKPIIDWHGTAEQLGNESYYTNGFPSTLFVTTKTRFTIHRLTLTPLVPAPTPAAAPTIPAEILAFNGHRYLLVGDAAGDFASAETKAQAMGGHLATINSKEERDWVRDEIWLKRAKPANVHRCLLGGRIAPDRKSGTWVTGESIDFNLWDGDRQGPDNKGAEETFVYITFNDGGWDDLPGDERSGRTHFLVEWDAPAQTAAAGLARVRAKLEAGQPITLVTMGDSMTDPNGGSNKPANWTTLLESKLEARFKSPVTVVNVGKASTKLPDSMAAIATWSATTPEPDLVLFCYGYNDWFAGTRGAAFQSQGEYAVKAIRRATKDKADVLIMTTIPTLNHWETMAELAEAGRRAAKATDAGLADLWQAFHQAIPDAAERPPYYAADKIHFSPLGHELAAQTAFDAIAAASSTEKAPSLPVAAPTPAKRRVASDEWIDVVPLIDPALDKYDIPNLTGKNEWRIENGELVAAAEGKPCKLLLPLDLDGMSSEVEAEFTRTSGTKGFNFDVPVASGPCPLHFDRDGDDRALLGKTGIPLGGKVSIETGKRGTIRMVVRRANGVDEVEAWFNGASLGKWTGNRNDIAMNRQEGYPHDRRLSMWIFGDPFVFHRVRARMLDGGTAETLRPVTIPDAVGAIVAP